MTKYYIHTDDSLLASLTGMQFKMESCLTVIWIIGAAMVLVGAVFFAYQLFRLVETDARCRGLKRPKLWGALSIASNNQSGLILYLIGRRKYPVSLMTDEDKERIERCKKKIGVGILFLAIGAILCVWGIVFYLPGN